MVEEWKRRKQKIELQLNQNQNHSTQMAKATDAINSNMCNGNQNPYKRLSFNRPDRIMSYKYKHSFGFDWMKCVVV